MAAGAPHEFLRERIPCSVGNFLVAMCASVLAGIGLATMTLADPGDTGRWAPFLRLAWATPWFLAGYALMRQSRRFNPHPRHVDTYTVNLCPNCIEHANDPAHDWLEA